jgi:photosystem II stability/assembly factor-like uncharacterized protein
MEAVMSTQTALRVVLSLLILVGVAAAQKGPCWLRDGSSPAPSLVYLLCEQGPVLVTTDGGTTWSSRDTSSGGHLRNIDFIDANHGFAVGDNGVLVATSNGGKKWEVRQTGVKSQLSAIQFVGQSGWAAGFDGTIIHSDDGGTTWAQQQTGTKEALEGLFFLDAQRGWAVGWTGTILRTVNGGKDWTASRSDAGMWSLTGVYFRDPDNGWTVGFGGQILRSHDGGVTWTALKSPVKSWLTSIAFDKANRGWIVSDEALLLSEDGGETWKPIEVEDKLFLAQIIPVNGKLWAVGQLGVMVQADGTKWKKLATLVPDDPTREDVEPVASATVQ